MGERRSVFVKVVQRINAFCNAFPAMRSVDFGELRTIEKQGRQSKEMIFGFVFVHRFL